MEGDTETHNHDENRSSRQQSCQQRASDQVEEEFRIESGFEDPKRVVDIGSAKAQLERTLRDRDNISDVGRDGASRKTDFSQSVGNSTQQSADSKRFHLNHKTRALENVCLTTDNADLLSKNKKLCQQLEGMRLALEQQGILTAL